VEWISLVMGIQKNVSYMVMGLEWVVVDSLILMSAKIKSI